jgi:hypothetical protein
MTGKEANCSTISKRQGIIQHLARLILYLEDEDDDKDRSEVDQLGRPVCLACLTCLTCLMTTYWSKEDFQIINNHNHVHATSCLDI